MVANLSMTGPNYRFAGTRVRTTSDRQIMSLPASLAVLALSKRFLRLTLRSLGSTAAPTSSLFALPLILARSGVGSASNLASLDVNDTVAPCDVVLIVVVQPSDFPQEN